MKLLDKQNHIKIYKDFISENPLLFSLDNTTSEEFIYYSCTFTEPQKMILTFTANGDITFFYLKSLFCIEKSSFTFFNIKNFIICDIKNEQLRKNIINLFLKRNLSFLDENTSLKKLIGQEKLDILFFSNKKFYKIKIYLIAKIHKNIENYFECTNVEIKDVKCHLCKKCKWGEVLNTDFVLTKNFCKFCKKCLEIVKKGL